MSLRESAERRTQKAVRELEARIAAIYEACKSKNAFSPMYLKAEAKAEVLKEQIRSLKSGRLAYEVLEVVQSIAETGFKRIKQAHKFGKSGGEAKRKTPKWEQSVLLAAKAVLARRKKHPSVRELARAVLKEINLPETEFETVRKRLPKILGK